MTRIPQEPQENPWTVPVVAGPAAVPTHISDITEQIRQQNATIQQEFTRLQNQLVENHSAVLARLDSLPINGANSAASRQGDRRYTSITRVKYVQDMAMLAYLVVRWIDPNDGSTKGKGLGPYKAVGTQQEFNLVDEGIPDGASVRFSSYVAGIGEYENDRWFTIDSSCSQGVTFRQTGTAFKGWFQCIGLYRPFIAHDNSQSAGTISRLKYLQNAAVLSYLIARWTDPTDGSSHSKDLGRWKAIATNEEFNLVDEGIPEGSSVKFASCVAGVGEYPNDLVFTVDSSASEGALFRQTGTAFKGSFTLEDLYRSLPRSVDDIKN
ncbi:hypothetical protein DFH09DRAFT_1147819 [Mycena vulgaris]|nr:hypothetical protein DFH09DRAFT_1147819 [Mycena vulgaris]